MPIKAKILADSISPEGKRITTFEIHLPKVLLAEFNTHAMISRNFSSSRAIPNSKNTEIESFEPLFYGKNQAGMVAKNEEIEHKQQAQEVWKHVVEECKRYSNVLSQLGLHKQWANRPNDWHVMAKGVATATEWENFFWLRDAEDAQPELAELASQMRLLIACHVPQQLTEGEWHLPYMLSERSIGGELIYIDPVEDKVVSLEEAKMISVARCAAVSYRTENIGIEKAQDIYKKLFSGNKVHASPSCHQATPVPSSQGMSIMGYLAGVEGVTHVSKNGKFWSGNLCGWIQNRQLIPNNYKEG